MDVASDITLLKLYHNDTINTFSKQVQDIKTKIKYSHERIDQTHLMKFYFKAMSTSTHHYSLLCTFISNLNMHIN